MAQKTVSTILKLKKNRQKVVCLTAYDYITAKNLEKADVDIILVGDSLAMVALGYENTLSITMDEMIHHAKAVKRGAPKTLVVGDMPFMSYQVSKEEALKNAGRFIKEAGCQAVKLEGASNQVVETVRLMVEAGIPVMGHLGFTPQFINSFGGYFIQGKTADKAEILLEKAKQLQDVGIFSLVLEMVPTEVAAYITKRLDVPTIGIGAGPYCDGQVLVTDDLLGKFTDFTPSFVREYASLSSTTVEAMSAYAKDVREQRFPDEEKESFPLSKEEKLKLAE